MWSKEEKFFDSQLWLESDSEDFFSINGEFIPSSSISEHFPTDNVKKLADLFSESFNEDQVDEYQNLQGIETVTSDQKPEGKHTIPIKEALKFLKQFLISVMKWLGGEFTNLRNRNCQGQFSSSIPFV
ncbi:unnamed protein product [Camellia sinensis]